MRFKCFVVFFFGGPSFSVAKKTGFHQFTVFLVVVCIYVFSFLGKKTMALEPPKSRMRDQLGTPWYGGLVLIISPQTFVIHVQ